MAVEAEITCLAQNDGSGCGREVCMSQLTVGAKAQVSRVVGESQAIMRLKALGVCEGRWIEVLRKGDAWVLRVLGSRVGVSHRLIDSVRLIAA